MNTNALRLGIVGLGRGFMLTMPALKADPRVALAGAFDLRDEARVRFAVEFGAPAFETLDALLRSPDIDAVYVATPHELHAEQAIAALRAGKHVLVEKPMATSLADCARMERASAEAGKVLVVGPSHGFDAPVQVAAELVASGKYGAVRMVTALNFTDFIFRPRRSEELDSDRGGGVVYSQAAHHIDVVRRLVGLPVTSVRAVAANWDSSRPSEGAYTALMTFTGGAVASLTYSGYAHYDSDELLGWITELGYDKDPARYGEARKNLAALSSQDEIEAKLRRTYGAPDASANDALARYHEHFGFILLSCERADLKLTPKGLLIYGDAEREFLPIAPPELPRKEVIDEFVGACLGTRRPIHDGRWGFDTIACCVALLESSRRRTDVAPNRLLDTLSEQL